MNYPQKLNDEQGSRYNLVFFGDVHKHSLNYAFGFYHSNVYPINMHSHDFYEINIITNGHGRHYIGTKSIETNKFDVFFIPPNIKHGYYQIEKLEIFNILISPLFFDFFKNQTDNIPNLVYLFDIEPKLRINHSAKMHITLPPERLKSLLPYLEELDSLHAKRVAQNFKQNNSSAIRMNALILYCLAFICESSTKSSRSNPLLQDLIRSIELIHNRFADNISISELAEMNHMSEATFTRLFKKNLNVTPSQYIINLRLEQAANLLTNTQKSIAEIAQSCGFFDSSHFIDKFKRKYQLTPKDYRKQHLINKVHNES